MKNRIKQILEKFGMRQKDMAERLGIGNNVVNRWVKGTAKPSAPARSSICKTFGIRKEWLERGEGEMFAPSVEVDEEREREIQHAFCLKVFNSLPPEIQKVVLDALRDFSSQRANPQTPKKEPADLPPETYSTVAQTGKDGDLNA